MKQIDFTCMQSMIPSIYANVLKVMEINVTSEHAETAKSHVIQLLALCMHCGPLQRNEMLRMMCNTFVSNDTALKVSSVWCEYDACYQRNAALFSKEQFDEIYTDSIAVEIYNLSR